MKYGPVPIMSFSILKVVSVSFGMMIGLPTVVGANSASRYDVGSFSLITAVEASVAVNESTGASGFALLETAALSRPLATKRSQLAMRSAISKGRPLSGALLCHLAFGWIFTVSDIASGDHSQDFAMSGMYSLKSGSLPKPGLALTRL